MRCGGGGGGLVLPNFPACAEHSHSISGRGKNFLAPCALHSLENMFIVVLNEQQRS